MSVEQRIGRFKTAWLAGERPSPDEVVKDLDRATALRVLDELAGFLATASDPAARSSMELIDGEAGLWPSLLPRLRRAMRARRDDFARDLAAKLGLGDAHAQVARRLHELESGAIRPPQVSRRLLDALAELLGTSVDELEDAAAVQTLGRRPRDVSFARGLTEEPPFSEVPPGYVPGDDTVPPCPQVDELFFGGR